MRKLNLRHAPILLAFFTSLFMSFLMSMIITFVNIGAHPDFFVHWMNAFGLAFPVAFPSILLVLPLARRLVARLVSDGTVR